MITSNLANDSRDRPDLFRWNGRVDAARLHAWLEANQLSAAPDDLVSFWGETGGGDVFETETILGPGSDIALGDDIRVVNRDMQARGMSSRFIVFHAGSFVSAIDTTTKDYADLDESSFDEWYAKTLRAEFGARYGLR